MGYDRSVLKNFAKIFSCINDVNAEQKRMQIRKPPNVVSSINELKESST